MLPSLFKQVGSCYVTSIPSTYSIMTIITSEPRVTVKLEVNKPRNLIQTILPLTPLRIDSPQPESTTLVRDFILSFKELENYKLVYNLELDIKYAYLKPDKEWKTGHLRWSEPFNRSCYGGIKISCICFPRRISCSQG